MIIQYHINDVTFFPEDQEYFDKRLQDMQRFLGAIAGDEDSVKADITISKDRHHSGERFHAKAHITAPHGGDFFAETDAKTIKALADQIRDPLERQMRKFHTKLKG